MTGYKVREVSLLISPVFLYLLMRSYEKDTDLFVDDQSSSLFFLILKSISRFTVYERSHLGCIKDRFNLHSIFVDNKKCNTLMH